ncbi:MobA/MobL family protein [Sphingomonas sp. ZB1N12]|uniref:MobA/MobL family protein n=1 Tax=Sphingomonas arabinosi TaxID=3096160 RepID=UPI002FCAB50C
MVQHRLVAEFPDVFGLAQKCAVVAALKADFERLKFRYTIVVHTPDHTNDGRNEHLHAIWYEGPCERTADGKWSFDRSAGVGVKLRPGEIARILRDPVVPRPDTDNPRELAAADVRVLRARFAGYCNRELESLGSRRRLDPRRYEDMGIDQEPSEHLGTDAARLVAAGVSVDVDYANAMKTWQARQRALDAEAEQSRQAVANVITEAAELTYAAVETDKLQAASDAAIAARRALDLVDLYDEMARSAALRLKRNVEGVLIGIKNKKASRDDILNEKHIRARHNLAIGHLAEIDEGIGIWVEGLGTFRKDVENLEAKSHCLSEGVRDEIKKANVTAQRSASRDWASSTILPIKKYPQRPAPHAHFTALKALIESPQARLNVIADGAGHWVDGIGTADQELLKHPEVANRAKPFLSAVHVTQRLAIYRLHSFIAQHGVGSLDPQKAKGRGDVPKAIANMLALYSQHPEYLAGVAASDEEYHRHNPAPGPVQVPTLVTDSAPAVGAEPADLRTIQSAPAMPAVMSVPSVRAAATETASSVSRSDKLSVIDTTAPVPAEDGRQIVPRVAIQRKSER